MTKKIAPVPPFPFLVSYRRTTRRVRFLLVFVRIYEVHSMKITSKGQVTIPQELRERAGLMPGCEVEFCQARDGRVFIKKLTNARRGRSIVDRLRGQGSVRMTTEEILNLTRGK